ncbi:hypothetical protein Q0P47_13715, partial [Staphylococcus aureus]|nr:hypothetical protein [Staphylococcus aureus]
MFNKKVLKKTQEEKKEGEDADLAEADKDAQMYEAVLARRREYGFTKYYFLMLVRFIFEGTEMNM